MKHDMHPAPLSRARSALRFLAARAGAVGVATAASAVTVTRTLILTVTVASIVAGCVTINIYFPAAAAEKAADRIIEEIYQLRKDAPAAKPAEAK